MSSLKRTASSRSTRLTGRVSVHDSAVTLFQLQDGDVEDTSSSDSPRRSKRVKTEVKTETVLQSLDSDSGSPKKRGTKAKSPRKVKPIQQTLATPHPVPKRWREAYDTIKEMRSQIVAPVDTMGCDQAQVMETDVKSKRFITLISLMLSSQTKDEVTDAAVANLRRALGGTVTIDGIINADESTISDAIAKVGFWRRKTQYIKQTAQRLRDDFDSDVPKTVDELCSLPGVGPKMAFLTLQVAWNLNLGIGVDVHVHRITNRLGWHKPPTKNPEGTRLNLQSWLPKELHHDINHLLVGFGQTICLPVGPRCDLCTLSSGLCPSAQKNVKSEGRKTLTMKREASYSGPQVLITLDVEEDKTMTITKVEEDTS